MPRRPEFSAVGRNQPRLDGADKVTGRSQFADDVTLPGMLHGAVLGSPHAHARILSYDTTAAEALDGVAAVLTGDDFGLDRIGPFVKDDHALAKGKVRYMGDPVAIVAADDEYIATAALDLIEVEYEPLTVVGDPEYARTPDAPVLHDRQVVEP